MKPFQLAVLFILATLILAGCWDKRNIKDTIIINGLTFDTFEEDPEMIQSSVRALNIQGSGGGKFNINDELVTTEGKDVIEIDINFTNGISGEMDISKAHVVVIGEDLAKSKGVLPLLEPVVRSRFGYISSKLLIAEGRGMDILSVQMDSSPIAFRLLKMFKSAEERTHIPDETVFSIWNTIEDVQRDPIIPLVKKSGANEIEISGTALFNGDKYSGYSLSPEQSTLLLFMMDHFNKLNFFHIEHNEEDMSPFSIIINEVKQKKKLKLDEVNDVEEIVYEVDIKLLAEINNYGGSISKTDMKKFNSLASQYMTEKAKEVVNILIAAESDVLGIQKEISVHYPQYLDNKEWKNVYSNIQIKPNITVEVTGSLNIK
ncbi:MULTISPECIES: Ger(x)C family spore germination protein [unclassified Sutcliffiella]|uniref:Ger(x)C family spore germination protein n=1 Tax=unclassified Sutcliffiella TaxID=2837532 RepID=UPI0030D27A57